MDVRLTWTDCDEAGDYVVPNVLSPRDLVSRPDNVDETVLHMYTPLNPSLPYNKKRYDTQCHINCTVLIVHRIVLFGPGSLLPRWRTEKQAKGRCQHFIIYKCYSELFTSIDRTCERNIDF